MSLGDDHGRVLGSDRERHAAARLLEQGLGTHERAELLGALVPRDPASEGPELDLLVPAVDRGADLDSGSALAPIVGCRERARAFVDELSLITEQPIE